MNLKQRFSIIFSLLFSVLLGGVLLFIFTMFSQYRKEDFEKRLEEKAETTIKLLLEVKEIDIQLLKIIDKNTIQKLYNEKIVILDEQHNLVYTSLDDAIIRWNKDDLRYLKKHLTFFRTEKDLEVFGMYHTYQNKKYYAFVTAKDEYGKRKLIYLQYLLWAAFLIGSALVWLLSFYLSKKSLTPLDHFTGKIRQISEQNLNTRLPETNEKNEVNALSKSFNLMISRIDQAYKKQKEFTGNASHELRTPLTRITLQLENILQHNEIPAEIKNTLQSITNDVFQLSDVVMSLLLFAKIENESPANFRKIRLDEIIFNSVARVKKSFPELKFSFEIDNQTNQDPDLEISGDESLLSIAFQNLIKNAFIYSSDQHVNCLIRMKEGQINVQIINRGISPQKEEIPNLFTAFSRGGNSQNKAGSGLGLLIVKRIMQFHNAMVTFTVPDDKLNVISINFSVS